MKNQPLLRMLWQLLLLLPAFFFAWYSSLYWILPLLADLLEPVLRLLWPDSLVDVLAAGNNLNVIVRLTEQGAAAAGAAAKGISLNPFSYSYGIPLYAALAIASEASWQEHLARVLGGLVILTLGIGVSILASLLFMFQFGTGFERLTVFASPADNDTLVRYCHFLGFNVLPRVLPLALWLLFYRDWVGVLLRSTRKPAAATGGDPPRSQSS